MRPIGKWCAYDERAAAKRTYRLLISLRRNVRVDAGSLGILELPRGIYTYTGSARRSIAARIARHLSREKRVHWHIDYVLTRPEAHIIRVDLFEEDECLVNQRTGGVIVAAGFGSSDCRCGCGAHLKRHA